MSKEGTSNYPSSFAGALFFSDYSRNCIWVIRAGASGLAHPATRAPLLPSAASPAQLKIGPGGDLYYLDFNGTVRRIRYFPGNQPPTARLQATPTTGAAPLRVRFDATGSTDPENGPLAYAWDLDDDGQFDDASIAQPEWTYAGGAHVARVRIADSQGFFDVAAASMLVNETAPNATIDAPSAPLSWKAGDLITFAGSATDAQDGTRPAANLEWSVTIQHCPASCHSHPYQSFKGVAGGSFSAPAHEYPSYIELSLTATDSAGLRHTVTDPHGGSRGAQPRWADPPQPGGARRGSDRTGSGARAWQRFAWSERSPRRILTRRGRTSIGASVVCTTPWAARPDGLTHCRPGVLHAATSSRISSCLPRSGASCSSCSVAGCGSSD